MNTAKILWVDDEVDLLKPHIMFLTSKGYEVDSCNNGYDAIEMVQSGGYDLVILDEMMPGITGLETLPYIKEQRPGLPVIMVTKSEEEMIMDKAIGSKIADYIIKPVNPNQVLLSIKKNIHSRRLVSEQATADYRSEFGRISASLGDADTFAEWKNIYKKLVGWELELSGDGDESIRDVLSYQREEAGVEFSKFVRRNYKSWINDRDAATPVMSHTLLRSAIFPEVEKHTKTTPLRPVAVGARHRRQPLRRHERRFLLLDPAHGDAVRPQRHFRGSDPACHRQTAARQVAQRQRGGG